MALVLVADDQASVRGRIRALLEGVGHAVVEARDGGEAIGMLSDKIDLVITDVLMPVNDGLEVCRHVRQHFSQVPVIVVTGGWGNAEVDLLSVAVRLGANLAIPKAGIGSQLLPAVEELLPSRPMRPATKPAAAALSRERVRS